MQLQSYTSSFENKLSRRHLAPRLPTDLPNRPFESAILPRA